MAMRGIKLSTVVLWTLAVAGSASAADLRLPMRAPPLAPAFSWTGCYLGGYVGGAWSDRDATFSDLGNSAFRA
jgi:outer membrane immunogenic protein